MKVEVHLNNRMFYIKAAKAGWLGSPTVTWRPHGGCSAAWEYLKGTLLGGWHPML